MPASNGFYTDCDNCHNPYYINQWRFKRNKKHLCSEKCIKEYREKSKLSFICKTCFSIFERYKCDVTKAEKRNHIIQYCSLECRNNDTERMTEKAQLMNLAQLTKTGLNKLELAGREWLQGLGYRLNEDFFEQVLLFNKFCVDVYFPREKLVIQFDGNFWHTKEKRKKLDESQDAYLKKCGLKVFRITDKEMYCKNSAEYPAIMNRFITAMLGENISIQYKTA